MPSTYTQNYYHVVFSTLGRQRWLTRELKERLVPFIGGILRDKNCVMLACNGPEDHLHLLVRYPADLSQSDLVRHAKARSSKWIHESFPSMRCFAWQEGYGGFTVSSSAVPTVTRYIQQQEEHHRRRTFEEEFLTLLEKHGIDFNRDEVFK